MTACDTVSASVAQLDRVSVFGTEGYRFKSYPGYFVTFFRFSKSGFSTDEKKITEGTRKEQIFMLEHLR
jgi:hypothetical protein